MTRKQTPCVQQLDSAAPDMFARLSTVAHFGWCANRNGFRERRPRKIAENYIKGWFFIDFLSCLPVGYVQYFISAGGEATGDEFTR